MTANTADAVVIGAGVVGCSVAHELVRDGMAVLVVDRASGPGFGSTSASSAIVRFNYSAWDAVATAWESFHCWIDWEDHLDGRDEGGLLARFVKTGGLVLDSPLQDRHHVLSLFQQAQIPFEEWDAEEIAERFPQIEATSHYPPKRIDDDDFWNEERREKLSGYWTPDAGFVDDPQFAAHNLMVAAQRKGARFAFGQGVLNISKSGDRVAGVELADGTRIAAPVVVNAAGPQSGRINALAGVLQDAPITTRPLRQEVHQLPESSGYESGRPGPFVADLDLGIYFRGTLAGGLLVGGTEPECDELEWLDDPDEYKVEATQPIYRAQAYRVARRLPTLTVPNRPLGIAGVYDVSTDWVPIYDRTELPGFYVAIGTSGHQFKNAPVIGRYIAQIIAECENGADHDRAPVQWSLPRTGLTVNLGYFSRLRPLEPDANRNVMG